MIRALISCLVLSWGFASERPDQASLEERIGALDSEMARLQVHVQNLSKRSSSLSGEIESLELERAMLASKIEKTELQVELTDRELNQKSAEKQRLETSIAERKAHLMVRLRDVYKRGKLGYSQIFLKQSQLADLINAYHYSRFLTQKDHDAFNAFRDDLTQLDETVRTLQETRRQAQMLRDELERQEEEYAQILRKRNATLRRIRSAAAEKKQLMEDLRLEKEELEYVLEGLLSGDEDPLQRHLPVNRYKGRLDWPVTGDVLREFGVIRDPEFKTVRKQNGIDIDVPAGTPVRAVFSGRVIYADWFKSYGNLVIIDHGDQVASFYAHNAHLEVSRGQMVARNEVIGLSGDTGSLSGPFLHFEIRLKGKPKDPRQWLKSIKK